MKSTIYSIISCTNNNNTVYWNKRILIVHIYINIYIIHQMIILPKERCVSLSQFLIFKPCLPHTSVRASHSSMSLYSEKGSKFFLIEALKRIGSWGMIERFFLTVWRSIWQISKPSMKIWPEGWANRKRHEIREDLPAPVRPTTPIWSRWKLWHRIDVPK